MVTDVAAPAAVPPTTLTTEDRVMSTTTESNAHEAEPEQFAGEAAGVGEQRVHRDPLTAHEGGPPEMAIRHLIFGGWTSQALRTMVALDLADHLAHGSRTIDELAHATAVDAHTLRRLLAVLAAVGLCERTNDSTVTLTP